MTGTNADTAKPPAMGNQRLCLVALELRRVLPALGGLSDRWCRILRTDARSDQESLAPKRH